jgi:hypothetical protein
VRYGAFYARGLQRCGDEDVEIRSQRKCAISDYTREGGIAMISTNYFHAIDGRMRLGIPGVKGSWAKAQELKDRIILYQGINDVRPNPTTGNVLIIYDPQRISQYDILKSLCELGYLQDGRSVAAGLQVISAGGSDWGSALARVALEAVLSALVL